MQSYEGKSTSSDESNHHTSSHPDRSNHSTSTRETAFSSSSRNDTHTQEHYREGELTGKLSQLRLERDDQDNLVSRKELEARDQHDQRQRDSQQRRATSADTPSFSFVSPRMDETSTTEPRQNFNNPNNSNKNHTPSPGSFYPANRSTRDTKDSNSRNSSRPNSRSSNGSRFLSPRGNSTASNNGSGMSRAPSGDQLLRGEHWKTPSWAVDPSSQYVLESRKDGQLLQILRVDQKKCYRFGR